MRTPRIDLTRAPGVEPAVVAGLRRLIGDQWRCFLAGIAMDGQISELECHVSPEGTSLHRRRYGHRLRLNVPADMVLDALAQGEAFEYGNGLVVIPTLVALVEAGAFAGHAGGSAKPTSMAAFARGRVGDGWTRKFGRIWGAFNTLAMAGWVRLYGTGEDTTYSLTPTGRSAVATSLRHRAVFRQLADALPALATLHRDVRCADPPAAAVREVERLVLLCLRGWDLGPPPDDDEGPLDPQMLAHLDGVVLCPILVALTMPVYEQDGERIVVSRRGLIDCEAPADALDVRSWIEFASVEFLLPMLRLLAARGFVDAQEPPHVFRVTASGLRRLRHASAVAALAGSYLRTYARLPSLLFEREGRLFVQDDAHVDRLMNVFGTSRASSGPALKHVCTVHLSRVFDAAPISSQPLGVADMGCGDGRALRAMGEYILHHTARGRECRRHPIVLLGADLHDDPISRTRSELADLSRVEGISVRVVKADVSDPEGYDATVRTLGLRTPNVAGAPTGLAAFLHSFMFLIHNRTVRTTNPDSATTLLSRCVESDTREPALSILRQRFGLAPGDDPDQRALVHRIAAVFSNTYVRGNDTLHGFVAAADLVRLLRAWRPFAPHGFLAVEGHVPSSADLHGSPPRSFHPDLGRMPHAFRWGIHYISEQYLLSFREHLLAMALAGFAPTEGDDFGRAYPDGFPLVEGESDFRWRSVVRFVPT